MKPIPPASLAVLEVARDHLLAAADILSHLACLQRAEAEQSQQLYDICFDIEAPTGRINSILREPYEANT